MSIWMKYLAINEENIVYNVFMHAIPLGTSRDEGYLGHVELP